MKKRKKVTFLEVGFLLGIIFLLLLANGCEESFGLRFSPTEAQRQNAELTHLLARRANAEGLEVGSQAGGQLVKGTEASLVYTGRAKFPVDPDDFSVVNNQAQSDALKRPDMGGMMDSALEIGLTVATLIGGGAGITVARNLRRVHAKAKGFNEVVSQNELLKRLAPDIKETFKKAVAAQTPTTEKLVAEVRVADKQRMAKFRKES